MDCQIFANCYCQCQVLHFHSRHIMDSLGKFLNLTAVALNSYLSIGYILFVHATGLHEACPVQISDESERHNTLQPTSGQTEVYNKTHIINKPNLLETKSNRIEAYGTDVRSVSLLFISRMLELQHFTALTSWTFSYFPEKCGQSST